jgi:hypothetical protein
MIVPHLNHYRITVITLIFELLVAIKQIMSVNYVICCIKKSDEVKSSLFLLFYL